MDGYATARTADLATPGPGAISSRAVTEPLGCTDTIVALHRLGLDATLELPTGTERLLVPVGGGPADVAGRTMPTGPAIAHLPADRAVHVGAPAGLDLVEIGVSDGHPDGSIRISPLAAWEFQLPATSDVRTAHLTTPLECDGMKVNVRELRDGQAVPAHTEGTQEELFVPLAEPARMIVDGEAIDTPVGTVTRVAPATVRSASNPGSGAVHWVMVGAPPTGAPTGWDPGAEIIE